MNDGKKKFDEIGAKLTAEKKAKEEQGVEVAQEAEKELEMIKVQGVEIDADTAEFFKQNASVGMENVGDSMPYLKITEALSKNEDYQGQFAPRGTFYYQPTKEVFKELEVAIIVVSRGFYGLDQSTPPQPKFNQLVGGIILDSMKPFVMFSSGTRWKKMNDFVRSLHPFTKSKVNPVPMFAFRVKLTLEVRKNDKGQESYVVNYNLVRNEQNQAMLITDRTALEVIRAGVDTLREAFDSFIKSKEVDRETGEPVNQNETSQFVEAERPDTTYQGETGMLSKVATLTEEDFNIEEASVNGPLPWENPSDDDNPL